MEYMRKMVKIMPPTYFMLLLAIALLSGFLVHTARLINPPYSYVGFLLITFGIIINLWADSLFKKMATTVKPHERPKSFVVSGPFRISRHPMYLGMVAVLLGCSLIFGTLLSFIFPIMFFVMMEVLFIGMEEDNLSKEFGKKYIEYKKRVRRWI